MADERDGWFDGKGIDLHRDDFLDHHAGWKRYMEDGQITAGEILEQEARITSRTASMTSSTPS
jgi:hypothetical protein